jgi:hypothetical protein
LARSGISTSGPREAGLLVGDERLDVFSTAGLTGSFDAFSGAGRGCWWCSCWAAREAVPAPTMAPLSKNFLRDLFMILVLQLKKNCDSVGNIPVLWIESGKSSGVSQWIELFPCYLK